MFRSTTFRTASEPVAGGHFHLSDFQSWGLAYARWAKQPNMMGCRKDTHNIWVNSNDRSLRPPLQWLGVPNHIVVPKACPVW